MSADMPTSIMRITRRRPAAGQEQHYELLVCEMLETLSTFAGFRGADLIPPRNAGDDYQIQMRFDSVEQLQAWDQSDEHREIVQRLTTLGGTAPVFQLVTAAQGWFSIGV